MADSYIINRLNVNAGGRERERKRERELVDLLKRTGN
jgi:hypothetical protein